MQELKEFGNEIFEQLFEVIAKLFHARSALESSPQFSQESFKQIRSFSAECIAESFSFWSQVWRKTRAVAVSPDAYMLLMRRWDEVKSLAEAISASFSHPECYKAFLDKLRELRADIDKVLEYRQKAGI